MHKKLTSCLSIHLLLVASSGFFSAALLNAKPAQFRQVEDPFGAPAAAAKEPAARPTPSKKQEGETDEPKPLIQPPKVELPPTFVKLYLLDGDIVSGELETNTIAIQTDFGTLAVPIEKIVRFEPGLNSYPNIVEKLNQLVADLGSTKYDERQAAHKALVDMGPRIQNELKGYQDDNNAERKRHLEEIKKEITKIVDELDEDDMEDPDNRPWERHDKLVMANFTAVGKIQQTQFKLKGKYGDLSIQLSDIRKGSRPVGAGEPIQKSITVNKDNFVQLQWKSSGISLTKGDMVTVSAKGTITLTPWGTNAVSSPRGTPQYGMMPNTPGIPYGALVAKIGNGKYFLVGDKKSFRADASGKLQFGITMRSSYVGKSYQYPGDYKLKVKVEPGARD